MHLKTVFIRFYKSFNYDYLRKNHPKANPDLWDRVGSAFYPFVQIPIDTHITTVVGANESGKSHLLSAIEKGVSGVGIQSEDFCRYSQFFAVTEGDIRTPEFGLEWGGLSEKDKSKIRELCNLGAGTDVDQFILFRLNNGEAKIFLKTTGGFAETSVRPEGLIDLLPRTFHINSEIALPESVSLHDLISGPDAASGLKPVNRSGRHALLDAVRGLSGHADWFRTHQTIQQSAQFIQSAMDPIARLLSTPVDEPSKQEQAKQIAQVNLARDLIIKVARIAPEALRQLQSAIQDGNDGHANGIIEKINAALAARLNFPKFWVQDRDFSLIVSAREYDLVFTIRDRTGTQYAFKERSSGLKYFLSYYIQYLAHESHGPETEILLMDEPDAYLSSQAQQDLLKVFAAYAAPEETTRRPVQVIYVTHSPFLIDKNHADRIRVLEKGSGDEGTRVVKDVARNHYEPLRSAFGAFVGETTFIGNCNLMVEGTADQILLAGAATYLRKRGVAETETLDLNRITIVPAGSAAHIPYLAYLARGRDIERPAVIALLDGDNAGNHAKKAIAKGGARHKQVLDPKYVLQINDLDWSSSEAKTATGCPPIELEDMIPLSLCTQAIRRFAKEYWGAESGILDAITDQAVQEYCGAGKSIYDALQTLASSLGDDLHLDKAGFARAVIDELPISNDGLVSCPISDGVIQFERNMKLLFRRIRDMQRMAEKELSADRVSQKIERLKRGFLQDHPEQATREQASVFLSDIQDALDETLESDAARDVVRSTIREFGLNEEILSNVPRYPEFRDRLNTIRYAGRLATQDLTNSVSECKDRSVVANNAPQAETTLQKE